MEEKNIKQEKFYKKIMLILVTAFITFILTSYIIYTYLKNNPEELTTNIGSSSTTAYLKKVRKAIDKYYLWNKEINEDELEEGAIQGYVAGLGDKYTEYIPAKDMQEYTENLTGSFVGIGIYMIADKKSDKIIVYYPIPDSPAEKSGIKSGDKIIKVNDVEYTAEDFDTISDYIKGEEGTKVNLVIERENKQLTFEIVRTKINTNPITIKKLENNIGYLNLPSFDDKTSNAFKEKVEELQKQGVESLIIDLRNNGGGIVDEATKIADYILDKGKIIISTVDNTEKKEVIYSKNKPIFNMPIAILVNENTASASEILTAALKDYNKASVIGTKTFGKGVIQTFFTLSDGSGLKITTAEYYTPKGNTIHEIGVIPDEIVELPKNVDNIYAVTEENDTQLKKAIKMLSK